MFYTYDPARISRDELPIARRARVMSDDLWIARTARAFCNLLRHDPDPDKFGFTAEVWESIAAVARGEMWPVPDRPYTREDWARDESFSAVPGQEVAPYIYTYMLNCITPIRLPRCQRTEGFEGGFLVGEPASSDPETGVNLYSAFGKIGDRRFYIGLLPIHPKD